MNSFILHGTEIFILFLAPVFGLIFDFAFGKKTTIYILIASLVLLIPILFDFSYVFPFASQVLALVALSCVYRFFSVLIEKMAPKVVTAIIFSGLLLFIFGYFAFIDMMAGSQKVVTTWKVNNYRIEYTIDQGFSGGPLKKYEISKYWVIPILIKKMDYAVVDDSTSNCLVHFNKVKLNFDRCNIALKGEE